METMTTKDYSTEWQIPGLVARAIKCDVCGQEIRYYFTPPYHCPQCFEVLNTPAAIVVEMNKK